jgi:hypothetical protein
MDNIIDAYIVGELQETKWAEELNKVNPKMWSAITVENEVTM